MTKKTKERNAVRLKTRVHGIAERVQRHRTKQSPRRAHKTLYLKAQSFFQDLYHSIINVITGDKPEFRQYSGFNSRPNSETNMIHKSRDG
jgi:hypothetical protein